MKYATGRGTRCKHATSMEWDEVEKKQRKSRLRYSTGRNSRIERICGALLNEKQADKGNKTDQKKDIV